MRSAQVHRALLQIPNRYALCQTVSHSARRLHRSGSSIDGSLNTALDLLARGDQSGPASPALPKEDSTLSRQTPYDR